MAKAKVTSELKTASKSIPVKAGEKVPPKKRSPKSDEKEVPPVENRKCSFCGHAPTSTNFLIAGPPPYNCFICETCVEVCVTVLLDVANTDWTRRLLRLMSEPKKSRVIPLDSNKKGKGK